MKTRVALACKKNVNAMLIGLPARNESPCHGRRAFSSCTGHLHIVRIEIAVAHDADFFDRIKGWPHDFKER